MKSLKTNFWLDTTIFAGFLAALQPRLTGIAIHEWLSLAAAGTLVLHVALHWDWAVQITRKFFHNLFHASRLNYIVDALLFIAFTLAITSGLVISRVVLPAFGLQMLQSRSWLEIHNTSANLVLLLVALHFALHWSWVRNTFRHLIVAPFKRLGSQARPQPQSSPAPMNRIKAL
jgi:cytochrome b